MPYWINLKVKISRCEIVGPTRKPDNGEWVHSVGQVGISGTYNFPNLGKVKDKVVNSFDLCWEPTRAKREGSFVASWAC